VHIRGNRSTLLYLAMNGDGNVNAMYMVVCYDKVSVKVMRDSLVMNNQSRNEISIRRISHPNSSTPGWPTFGGYIDHEEGITWKKVAAQGKIQQCLRERKERKGMGRGTNTFTYHHQSHSAAHRKLDTQPNGQFLLSITEKITNILDPSIPTRNPTPDINPINPYPYRKKVASNHKTRTIVQP